MNIQTPAANPVLETNAAQPRAANSRGIIRKLFLMLVSNLFSLGIIALLIFGWNNRDNNYLSAETGAGYILGITGASLMLVLLLYPLSKRVAFMTRLIPIRFWFGFHMLLGVVGPVMILFHSNFHLGSTNSNIALICMLLVAGSGLVGRYIYTHIHHGLYGTKISLAELKKQASTDHQALSGNSAIGESQVAELNQLEAKALQIYAGIIPSLWHVLQLGISTRRTQKRILKSISSSNATAAAGDTVKQYMLRLRQVAAFRVYERLFSLWHILHLPLFFMMIITAIIHVFAVHVY
ncbi:MAG: transcriptional regulator [Gammaproteobacteria bacterium]